MNELTAENGDAGECPGCGSDAFGSHPSGISGMYWCGDCEREFWHEGSWYSCDETGVAEHV